MNDFIIIFIINMFKQWLGIENIFTIPIHHWPIHMFCHKEEVIIGIKSCALTQRSYSSVFFGGLKGSCCEKSSQWGIKPLKRLSVPSGPSLNVIPSIHRHFTSCCFCNVILFETLELLCRSLLVFEMLSRAVWSHWCVRNGKTFYTKSAFKKTWMA